MRTRVLVIGGGPAGATAARALSLGGVETVLLDRGPSFVKPCGGGIPSGAFREMDIPLSLVRRRVHSVRLVAPSGEETHVSLGEGFIGIVQRGEFDLALRSLAREAGAQILEGGFNSFVPGGGGGIRAEATVMGKPLTIEADWAVAADGVNSRALASLGLRPSGYAYTVSVKSSAEADSCEFWFGSEHAQGFYSWVFPQARGVSVGTGSTEPARAGEGLRRFLIRRGLPPEGQARGYRIPLWGEEGPPLQAGRVLVAGDAAGMVMPLTFEGIYYAMAAGRLAAQAMLEGRPDDYARRWRRSFQGRFAIMRKLWARFLRDDPSMERLVSLCRGRALQEASKALWLEKSASRVGLASYVRIFKSFVS
ncbi:MAG: NAD(P)/FAD-dependent oxidoreductase [Thermodesulfovibrionales bacterium]